MNYSANKVQVSYLVELPLQKFPELSPTLAFSPTFTGP